MKQFLIKYLLFKPVHHLEKLITGREKMDFMKPTKCPFLAKLAYKLAKASL